MSIIHPEDDMRMPVHLNVYDLILPQVPDWTVSALYNVGVGFFHSGVAIFGTEYCFGGHPEPTTGVFEVPPRKAPAAKFRESVVVGYTSLSPIDVALLVNQMAAADIWRGNNYNLLSRNCNHFASELCEKLTGNQAPTWINRLAWMGERAKFLLPEGIDTPMAAPVQAPGVRDTHDLHRAEDADPDED